MDESENYFFALILFLFILLIQCCFYGFSTAIQNLNEQTLKKNALSGNKKALSILKVMDDVFNYVNMIQIIITLGNIITGWFVIRVLWYNFVLLVYNEVSGVNLGILKVVSFVLLCNVALILLLTFGVLLPKKLAVRNPEKWAEGLVGVIQIALWVFTPLTWLIQTISLLSLRIFGIDPNESIDDVTEEEIISMVNEGHEQGLLLDSEAEMIHNIFELNDTEAKDIMTHRKNITALDQGWTLEYTFHYILEKSNTRFPVYDEDIDNVVGVVHFREVVLNYTKEEYRSKSILEIPDLIKDVSFIPETRNINVLFKDMQSYKQHMAIVVDEYGQTAGLVAMEDIIEEIVGNILDEYDEDENFITPGEDGSYLMKGLTPLEDIEDILAISFEAEDVDTLNGFLTLILNKIPEETDLETIEYQEYSFQILSVENKMINLVKVREKITEEKVLEENLLEP